MLLYLCLYDAAHRSPRAILLLLVSVSFGILLAQATIKQLDVYRYGTHLLLVIDIVPLAIGIGWGVIFYSTMLFTDYGNLSPKICPVADTPLVLNKVSAIFLGSGWVVVVSLVARIIAPS